MADNIRPSTISRINSGMNEDSPLDERAAFASELLDQIDPNWRDSVETSGQGEIGSLSVPDLVDEFDLPNTLNQANETGQPNSDSTGLPVDSQNPQVGSPNSVLKWKQRLYKGLPLVCACTASLFVGLFLSTFRREPSIATLPVEPMANPASAKYVSAVGRRHEPIIPIAPIDGLEPGLVELGRRLFHDPALSGNGKVSCSTCHVIETGGDDGLARSVGITGKELPVNTPTVLNSAYNIAQFWDGRAPTLEDQVGGPINNPDEMGSSWPRVIKYLRSEPSYRSRFSMLFDGEATPERVSTAIATYERSLITVNSKFDEWLQGDDSALTVEELHGYQLFTRLNCVSCHQGAAVGGNMFQRLGVMAEYFTKDRETTAADLGRFNVTGLERDKFVFRVPSLRNVESTAPYFHDGSIKNLETAVRIMIERQLGLQADEEQIRRIVLFLKTLSGKPNAN
ncbi:MAG: cytochrome-c peroxidase [Planctomycetales bacterium]|nr:cytochrome-c peroxidase [Planctomycetales bacterium]